MDPLNRRMQWRLEEQERLEEQQRLQDDPLTLSSFESGSIGASQAAFPNAPLNMSRIGFVLDPFFVPSDCAIESSALFRRLWTWAKAGPD